MWKEPTQLWLTCVCRGPRGYTHTDLPESPGLPPCVLMHVSHMYPSLGRSPPCLLPCAREPHLPIPCLCMRAHTPASDGKQPPEHLLSNHSPLRPFLHPWYQAAHRLVSARCRHYSKCFKHINSFNPHNIRVRWVLVLDLFYKFGN